MLLRIRGGKQGIRQYLETGRKQGRHESRDQLDERVPLKGDLDLVDKIIQARRGSGDNYLHVTLSFKEDLVEPRILQEVLQSFEDFTFSAFRPEEYTYYAEAHLPRIKTTMDLKTKALVIRKPHIHIIIPKINLLSQGHLNPFGMVNRTVKFLDAWQETCNLEFGLSSPKDNPRLCLASQADVLSRQKGDFYDQTATEFKNSLLELVGSGCISNFESLADELETRGEVRVLQDTSGQEYLQVIPHGWKRGLRLKDKPFRPEYFKNKLADVIYQPHEQLQETKEEWQRTIDLWHHVKAKEVKLVNSGDKKKFKAYQALTVEQKNSYLLQSAEQFYFKHQRKEPSIEPVHPQGRSEHKPSEVVVPTLPTTALEKELKEMHEKKDYKAALTTFRSTMESIRPEIVLMELGKSHGVIPADYPVIQRPDGKCRIQAGSRMYSVNDFLTKVMHFTWPQAKAYLEKVYGQDPVATTAVELALPPDLLPQRPIAYISTASTESRYTSVPKEKRRRGLIEFSFDKSDEIEDLRAFLKVREYQRKKIDADQGLSVLERHLARSAHIHQTIMEEFTLKQKFIENRSTMTIGWDGKQKARTYEEETIWGILVPQDLRRAEEEQHTLMLSLYRDAFELLRKVKPVVEDEKTVHWYIDDKPLFTDTPDRVYCHDLSPEGIEATLLFSREKFGKSIQLFGNEDYFLKVAEVVAKSGMDIVLTNPGLMNIVERKREAERERFFKAAYESDRREPEIKPSWEANDYGR